MHSTQTNKLIISQQIVIILITILSGIPSASISQNLKNEIHHFQVNILIPDSSANVIVISNSIPKQRIIVTNIQINQEKWWLINSKAMPKKEKVISWFYNEKKGTLTLQRLKNASVSSIDIEVVINTTENSKLELVECTAFRSDAPGKEIYPVTAQLKLIR